ncbi:hypothetical protein HDU67_005117 [Dinochytrium kinnereticum]|nr:hypothetical protein HDU67_005117 [Dinochytrium kinnereticum]
MACTATVVATVVMEELKNKECLDRTVCTKGQSHHARASLLEDCGAGVIPDCISTSMAELLDDSATLHPPPTSEDHRNIPTSTPWQGIKVTRSVDPNQITVGTFTIVEALLVSYQFIAMLLNCIVPRRPATRQGRAVRINLSLVNSLSSVVHVAILATHFLRRLFDASAEEEKEEQDGISCPVTKDMAERLIAQNRALLRRNAELITATRSLRAMLASERDVKTAMHRVHSSARVKIDTLEARVADLEAALASAKEALSAAAGLSSPAPSSDSGFDEDALVPLSVTRGCQDLFLSEKIDCALAAAAKLDDPSSVTEGDRYLFERFGIVSAAMLAFNEEVELRGKGLEDLDVEEEEKEEEDDDDDTEFAPAGCDGGNARMEGKELMRSAEHRAEEGSEGVKPLGPTDEFVVVAAASLAQPLANGSTPLSLSVLLDDLALKHSADSQTCARAAIRALLSHADLSTSRKYPSLPHPSDDAMHSAAARNVASAARGVLESHLTLLSLHAPTACERVALLKETERVCCEMRKGGLGFALRQAFPVVVFELYRSGVVVDGDVIAWWREEGGGGEGCVREGVKRLVASLEAASVDSDEEDSEEEEEDEEEEGEEEEEEDEEDLSASEEEDEVIEDVSVAEEEDEMVEAISSPTSPTTPTLRVRFSCA